MKNTSTISKAIFQISLIIFSQIECFASEIPIRKYSDYFHPPATFLSLVNDVKAKKNILKAIKLDLKKKTSEILFFQFAAREKLPAKRNYYVFGPREYAGINNPSYWIYIENERSKLESAFEFRTEMNEPLISVYIDKVPLPRSSSELTKKMLKAPPCKDFFPELTAAASAYAQCYIQRPYVFSGSRKRKLQSKTLIALFFMGTLHSDDPLMFVADENQNKIISFEPFYPEGSTESQKWPARTQWKTND